MWKELRTGTFQNLLCGPSTQAARDSVAAVRHAIIVTITGRGCVRGLWLLSLHSCLSRPRPGPPLGQAAGRSHRQSRDWAGDRGTGPSWGEADEAWARERGGAWPESSARTRRQRQSGDRGRKAQAGRRAAGKGAVRAGEGGGQPRRQDFISKGAQSPGKIRGPMGLDTALAAGG